MAVDKKELLKKYYDMANHNLMCYSTNLLMNEPKQGFENEWNEAKQESNLLKEMIEELKGTQELT